MRKSAPVDLIVHFPETEEGRADLARRTAEVHADAINQCLKSLNCPPRQKPALLDAVMEAIKRQNR